MRLDLHPAIYKKLLRLAKIDVSGRGEPLVGVIERLIREAPEQVAK